MRVSMLITCLLMATVAQASAPAAKQQVLWDQLRSTISEVEQRLDGVLGVRSSI